MRVKPFTSFLAPLALVSLIAAERPAEAVLTYYIYEPAGTGSVVVETLGSLALPASGTLLGKCDLLPFGLIFSSAAAVCTGSSAVLNIYPISGPFSFIGPDVGPDSASGIATALVGVGQQFGIDTTYTGGPIISSSTFGMSTLAGLGFTTTGLLGTWTLDGTGDTIEVRVAAPPAPPTSATPGPLPILGATAAFGSVRKLRRLSSALKQG
jgi:hypothetical protein